MADETQESDSEQIFNFITITGPQLQGDAESRRRVRSHVQAHYRRQNPHLQRRHVVQLNVTPLMDGSIQTLPGPAGNAASVRQYHGGMPLKMPSPVTLLDANRSDPFAAFNVVYDGTCSKFRSLIEIGFIDLARETIALSQMLSASAWHLVNYLKCAEDKGEDASYTLITTQTLQQKLNDPAACATDEVIVTVLALAAYAILNTSRIETNGRFRQDNIPHFPLPYHLLSTRSNLRFPILTHTRTSFDGSAQRLEESVVVRDILESFRQLNEMITAELSIRDLWHDVSFWVYNLSPILHELLAISRGSVHDNIWIRQLECFRLAGILYVTNLRLKIDPEYGSGMLYGSKLQMILGSPEMMPSWGSSNNFLIWILTVAACSSCLFDDLRNYFVTLLSESLKYSDVVNFDEFLMIIHGISWCDKAFHREIRDLETKIQFNQ
ncbi:hypothetical protein F5884DRAFT_683329 [Xylogone sp. PMI_703]|nr:hypothetical protein F5884DRAFT_683329 [Xylogone sp. PMI_703]